jgi:hypothetical protein
MRHPSKNAENHGTKCEALNHLGAKCFHAPADDLKSRATSTKTSNKSFPETPNQAKQIIHIA